MSDLTFGPPPERSPLAPILIAGAVLAVIAAAVFFLNPRKTAEITVPKVDLFAPHTEFAAGKGAPHVVGTPPETQDNLYAILTVHIEDKLRLPIFISSETVTLTLADDSVVDGQVIAGADYPRLEETFPAVQPMLGPPLSFADEIAPGGSREGRVLALFPSLTSAAWHNKKAATLTVNLQHQSPLTIALP